VSVPRLFQEAAESRRHAFVCAAVVLATTFTLVSLKLSMAVGINLPQGTNQVVASGLFIVVWAASSGRILLPRGYGWALSLMAIYLAGAYFYRYSSPTRYLLGTAFTFQFCFVFVLAYSADIRMRGVLVMSRWLLIAICVVSLVSVMEAVRLHVAIRDATTVFREAGALGGALNCGLVLALALYRWTAKKKYLMLGAAISIAVVATVLKKSIVGMLVVWVVFVLLEESRSRRMLYVASLAACLSAGMLIMGDALRENFGQTVDMYSRTNSDSIARSAMYIVSGQIAVDRFPFGSGMGSFASIPSVSGTYSRVYYDYGLDQVWGLTPYAVDKGMSFLLDTYWAHIVGELGLVGTAIFLTLWFLPARVALAARRLSAGRRTQGLILFLLAISAVTTVEGLALYLAENASFIIIHAGLAGFACRQLLEAENPVEAVVECRP
jgi:hypothetical protein